MTIASFVEKHKTAALVTTAVLAVGSGVGLYYALNKSSTSDIPADSADSNLAAKKKKNKKKNKKKVNTSQNTTVGGFPLTNDDGYPEYPVIDDFAKVAALPKQSRKELSLLFKTAGNYAYGKKDYVKGVELYTNALKCDDSDAIFLSNRAACYFALGEHAKVIEDTTKALEIQGDYTKCFSRRAASYEQLGQYSEACLDFTSACILSEFEDRSLNNSVDRVLALNAQKILKEKYANEPKKLPSPSFVTLFFQSFRKRVYPESVTNAAPDTGNYKLKLAIDAIEQDTRESNEQALKLLDEAVEAKAEDLYLALELRGSFRLLMADITGAAQDLAESLKLKSTVHGLIVLSSIHLEQSQLELAVTDLETALKIDPTSADVYYHRAQVAFLTSDFASAEKDYEKCLSLDPDFVKPQIQLAVNHYRSGNISTATSAFKKLLAKYPDSCDVHNYYGEILLDQGDREAALKEFDIAIEIEKKKKSGTINVLPMVNKSIALAQVDEISAAEKLCRQAYAIDPYSDIVLGTLAQLCLQQNNIEEAYKYFAESADVSRTDSDRTQALSYSEAARTQLRLMKERPLLKEKMMAAVNRSAFGQA